MTPINNALLINFSAIADFVEKTNIPLSRRALYAVYRDTQAFIN
jgi:hypothetical protein